MAILSQQFLQTIGVDLDEQAYQAFSEHFEETLGDRVIDEIIETLEEPQVQELVALREQDEEHLQTWLQANVPDLKEIVEDEVYILMDELVENAEHI